ncbi:MAG: type II toxin-antitoxin system VapC family toxin, partial [Fimbriimonadales bacterium]|nr:type II toxin-antitoxin system VapC family toxin [Fimbriimonadales bacterium]
RSGRLEIFAPDLLGYEYTNALWVAVRNARLTQSDARTAIHSFQRLGIQYRSIQTVWSRAVDIAFQYQRTFYDSVYVAVAEQLGVWFFTGDRRLYNALQPHLAFVRWVGDYHWDNLPDTPAL